MAYVLCHLSCGAWLMQHTATHPNTLSHTATHFNTLQHTATHLNTLQHTSTHCNTPQQKCVGEVRRASRPFARTREGTAIWRGPRCFVAAGRNSHVSHIHTCHVMWLWWCDSFRCDVTHLTCAVTHLTCVVTHLTCAVTHSYAMWLV